MMENPNTEDKEGEKKLKEVLNKAELPHFLTVFQSNGVTLELMFKLNHDDLKSIGMNRLVDRVNLFKAMEDLRGDVSKCSTPSQLSEVERNFLRATLLAYKIIPRAVRIFFDSQHPPANLIKELDSKERGLKSCKAVYKENYPKLFTSDGCTMAKSETFDLTLLMALLRNFTKIKEPVTSWNKMPGIADKSEGADLVRIRIHRNDLAHNVNAALSNKEFHHMWNDLENAGSRLSGGQLSSEIQAQKCAVIDDKDKEILHHLLSQEKTLQRLEREMESIQLKQSDRIPPNIKDRHLEILSEWKTEDKPFIETQAYFKIADIVDQYILIFIIGRPGEGKSAIARHIALKYEQKDYEVIPFTKSEEIFAYKKPGMKQIFVSNDMFGIFGVHQSTQKNELDDIFKFTTPERKDTRHLKIVITCRKMVHNELSDMYPKLASHEAVCDISDKSNEMNEDERRKIFQKHCSLEGVEIAAYRETLPSDKNLAMFPFMCKLFSKDEKFRQYGRKLFTNPHECLLKEIDNLMDFEENILEIPSYSMSLIHLCRVKYAALVLCMLKRNKLSETVLNDKDHETLRNEICKNCKISYFSSVEFLGVLRAMEGTYIAKRGNVFSFIHDSLLEVVACHYGRPFPDHIVLYQSSSYVANNVTAYESKARGELKVFLKEEFYPLLATRLLLDIKSLALYEVFMNDSLHHDRFCAMFLNFLGSLPIDQLKMFFQNAPLDSCTNILQVCSIISWKEETDRQHWREMERQNVLKMPPIRPINWVVNYGHHRIMQKLFDIVTSKGIPLYDLLTNCDWEQTRLLVLACYSGNKRLVRTVMKHVPNKCWNMHYCLRTPLTAACEYGHLEVIETLLKARVNVNAFDGKNDCPLVVAAEMGNNVVTEILLQYGADCNRRKCSDGKTPLDIAHKNNDLNTIQVLLEYCPSLNINKSMVQNILEMGIKNGNQSIVQMLTARDIDVNLQNKYGQTPVHVACFLGVPLIVESLLQKNPNCKLGDIRGATPLHYSLWMGNTDVTKLILKYENGHSSFQGNRLLFNILVDLQHAQVALDARDVPTITKIRTYSSEEFRILWEIIRSQNSDKLSHLLQIGLNANQHVSLHGEEADESDHDDKMSLLYIIACTEKCVQTRAKFQILLRKGNETQERNLRWKDFFPDMKLDFLGNRKCVSLLECLRQFGITDLVSDMKKHTRRYSI